jgi:hypothetical protein
MQMKQVKESTKHAQSNKGKAMEPSNSLGAEGQIFSNPAVQGTLSKPKKTLSSITKGDRNKGGNKESKFKHRQKRMQNVELDQGSIDDMISDYSNQLN